MTMVRGMMMTRGIMMARGMVMLREIMTTRGTNTIGMMRQYKTTMMTQYTHHHCHKQLLVGWGWGAIKQEQQQTRPLCHSSHIITPSPHFAWEWVEECQVRQPTLRWTRKTGSTYLCCIEVGT
jgi:hypothetical protein